MKTIILILMLLFTSQASAQTKWEFVATSDDGDKWYLAPKTLERKRQFVAGWVRLTLHDDPYDDHVLFLLQSDCNAMRSRYLQTTVYVKDGSVNSDSDVSKWTYPPPDSVQDTIIKRMCRSARNITWN